MGGWTVVNHTTDDSVIIPDEASAAFDKGGETYADVNLCPLSLLGIQLFIELRLIAGQTDDHGLANGTMCTWRDAHFCR